MKEQTIQVRKQDVLRYVLGESGYHPVEVSLDENYLLNERYEAFDAFIYDSHLKKRIVQELDYINFFKDVDVIERRANRQKRNLLYVC
mgnify:CR=1 FL=1